MTLIIFGRLLTLTTKGAFKIKDPTSTEEQTTHGINTTRRDRCLPNCVEQNIYKKGVTFCRDVAFGEKNLVITSLHQVLKNIRIE